MTPLALASKLNNEEAVELLLEGGAKQGPFKTFVSARSLTTSTPIKMIFDRSEKKILR